MFSATRSRFRHASGTNALDTPPASGISRAPDVARELIYTGRVVDAVRFAATFLRHGDGFILPALADEMITDQVHGLAGEVQAARVKWPVASWGLGWEIKGAKAKHWTGNLTSPQTFCHFGAAGTLLWADPTIDLAAAIFANRATFLV